MAYTKPTKQSIPTPATATLELHTATVAQSVKHFRSILTPTLMIAHRNGCYATVINSTINGIALEALLGTDNAKNATEEVLNTIQSAYSAIIIK